LPARLNGVASISARRGDTECLRPCGCDRLRTGVTFVWRTTAQRGASARAVATPGTAERSRPRHRTPAAQSCPP